MNFTRSKQRRNQRGINPKYAGMKGPELWRAIHANYLAVQAKEPLVTTRHAAFQMGISMKLLWNVIHRYAPRGFESHRHLSGRRKNTRVLP